MPRELVILSPEPITALECITATAAVDPALGVGRLWGGGGLQIADEAPVLAVLRSVGIDERSDTEFIAGRALPDGAAFWTEAYGPFGEELTDKLVRRLTADVGGTLVEMGATP